MYWIGVVVVCIKEVIDCMYVLLELFEDYYVVIILGLDMGVMEVVMWLLLGVCGVDVFGWDVFGNCWIFDVWDELKLEDLWIFQEKVGMLLDLLQYDGKCDVIFMLNGMVAGVWILGYDWIDDDCEGLIICDVIFGVFVVDIDWFKIDVLIFFWQKCLGGEVQYGMLIMGLWVIECLNSYKLFWFILGLFVLYKGDQVNMKVYEGFILNILFLMVVEDYVVVCKWVFKIGGLLVLVEWLCENFVVLDVWVQESEWVEYLCDVFVYCFQVLVILKFKDLCVLVLDVEV